MVPLRCGDCAPCPCVYDFVNVYCVAFPCTQTVPYITLLSTYMLVGTYVIGSTLAICLGLSLPTWSYRLGLVLSSVLWALLHLLLMVPVSRPTLTVVVRLAATDSPIVQAPVWLMTPPSIVLDIMLVRHIGCYRLRLL